MTLHEKAKFGKRGRNYTVFAKKHVRSASALVTINSVGRFYFNRTAASFFSNRKTSAVQLLWDDERLSAMFVPSVKGNRSAYVLAFSRKGGGATITAVSFLRWIGLANKSKHRQVTIAANCDEKNNVIEIQIPPEFLAGKGV
jgi:hypothetical protein